jgi:hypothetical protein
MRDTADDLDNHDLDNHATEHDDVDQLDLDHHAAEHDDVDQLDLDQLDLDHDAVDHDAALLDHELGADDEHVHAVARRSCVGHLVAGGHTARR